MLTSRRLAALVNEGTFGRVFEAVESGGRPLRPRVRQWLMNDERAREAAAGALALQRVCDLSYGPTVEADGLAAGLTAQVAPDRIGALPASALALVAAALDRFIQLGETDASDPPLMFDAIEALGGALTRLASLLEAGIETEEDAELLQWQLARSPGLAREVRARRVAASGSLFSGLARDLARTRLTPSSASAA